MTQPVNHCNDRGIAMLLVTISLVAATILTMGYVASRDNSAEIGRNVANGAAARWAAASAIDFSIAVLESGCDWRRLHENGLLISNLNLAGADVEIVVVDAVTGQPPTDLTEHVELTAQAVVNGVGQSMTAVADVPSTNIEPQDADLSEFAVYVTDRLEMRDRAVIARWLEAPISKLGKRIALGVQSNPDTIVRMSDRATAIDATIFGGGNSSSRQTGRGSKATIPIVTVADEIQFPDSPAPMIVQSNSIAENDLVLQAGHTLETESSQYHDIQLRSGAQRTIRGDVAVVTTGDLLITSGARLTIDGEITLVVHNRLMLDRGSIELTDGASLTIFVGSGLGSGLTVRSGYIGEERPGRGHVDENRAWMDPTRITIYSMNSSTTDLATWHITGQSIVKGSLYLPHAVGVKMEDRATVCGRIAARQVIMRNNAAVFYDHSMSSQPINSRTSSETIGRTRIVKPSTAGKSPSRAVSVNYWLKSFEEDVRRWEQG